jgi:hypothetical protein
VHSLAERAIRLRTLIGLAAAAALCLVVGSPTKDASGAEGAVSWIAFVGFWAGLVAAVIVAVALLLRRVAAQRP